MFLALAIGLNVFDRLHRRQAPSIGQRLSLDATKREASDNCHQHILKRVEVIPGRLRGPLLGWAVCSAAWTSEAIPRAIQDWMVFSLDVHTTREDRWDRVEIVPGYSGCRDFAW
jgi:hypothetical protein